MLETGARDSPTKTVPLTESVEYRREAGTFRASLVRNREPVCLALLIASVALVNLVWLRRDQQPMPLVDSYLYATRLLRLLDNFTLDSLTHFWSSLSSLSVVGRPPVYQVLSIPFVLLFGRSIDAAALINVPFLAILVVCTYKAGKLLRDGRTGLLAAVLVVSYPPIIQLSRMYLPHYALASCCALSLWLLLLMLEKRSTRTAWFFGASLALGLLTHANFIWFALVPTIVFGTYMLLFQTAPRLPSGPRNVIPWVIAKIRDPFFVFGLLPAALIVLALILPWYLTKGLQLFDAMRAASAPHLASLRGSTMSTVGFADVRPFFWWYAKTAPAALSNVLSFFALAGLVFAIFKRRTSYWVLVVTMVATYVYLSLSRSFPHAWWYFAMLLPVPALLSATWVNGLRPRWLGRTLAGVSMAVAAFNFIFVTWGSQPWNRAAAAVLGSPMSTGNCTRAITAYCPIPAEPAEWPVREVQKKVLEDPKCQPKTPCRVLLIHGWQVRASLFNYMLVKDRVRGIIPTNVGTRRAAQPYAFKVLLEADYILYRDVPHPAGSYYGSTVRFLQYPPTLFAHAHRTVDSFDFPDGTTARLVKRIQPLTAAEAEATIEAMELPEENKSQRFAVMTLTHAAEGRVETATEFYEQIPDERSRAMVGRLMPAMAQSFESIERVVAEHREILETTPHNLSARVALAQAYDRQGDTEKAVAELEQVLVAEPHNAWLLNLVAEKYRSIGEHEAAVAAYCKILQIQPYDVAIRVRVADLYGRMDRIEEEVAELEKALSQAPDNAWLRNRLAEKFRAAGRTDKANALLQDRREP